MQTSENILLIRLKSIGDIAFTLPAVHAVRENYLDAKITFLTSKENAALLRGFREVDDAIALDRATLRNPLGASPEIFRLLRRLRAEHFSLVVDFQGYGETAWLSWWSGAPERWGSVYGAGREWLYTRGVRRDNTLQIADWNLSLLRQCGLKIGEIKNEFVLPTDALAEAQKFFARNHLDSQKPTLFFQPFTSTPFKNWPLENYLALARHFRSQDTQIIFGGGPADRAALEPVKAEGFVTSAGAPLLVSAGLAKLSTVTIGGVTGLLHLAVAMRKRVVMLVGPVNESGFPYQHRDWGLTPETGENVAGIKIRDVIAACEKAINESANHVFC